MNKVFILLFLLSITVSCWAADYYVSPSGADNATGTEVDPWKTLSYAANETGPGDTVIALDGNYTDAYLGGTDYVLFITKSGNSTDWITFEAQNEDQATIDGLDNVLYGITISANYIIVDGFRITKAEKTGINVNNNHIIIKNCNINYNGSAAIGGQGIYAANTVNHITIEDNKIHHNGRLSIQKGEANAGKDHGIYINSSNTTISRNDIYENQATGIKISGGADIADITISNNKVHNQQNAGGICSFLTGAQGLVIEKNRNYENNDVGISINNNRGGHTVVHNTCYGNNGSGIYLSCNTTKIYNNTIYDNKMNNGIYVYGSNTANTGVKNNIMLDNLPYEMRFHGGATLLNQNINYNNYGSTGDVVHWHFTLYTLAEFQAATAYGDKSIQQDPLFTDSANDDFTLALGSPCINAGTSTSYDDALSEDSSWPSDVLTIDQDIFQEWEIGAYVWPYGAGNKIW